MWLRVSAINFQLFKLIMLEKCVLTILELNWNQSLWHKKTQLNICHHMLTSSTHLQNRSFHVEEKTRTSTKCQKMKNTSAKRAKILFVIVKYANLWGFCCRRRRGCLSIQLHSIFHKSRRKGCTCESFCLTSNTDRQMIWGFSDLKATARGQNRQLTSIVWLVLLSLLNGARKMSVV